MWKKLREWGGVAADAVVLVPIGIGLVAAAITGAYLELRKASPVWTVVAAVGVLVLVAGTARLSIRWFRNRFVQIGEESYLREKRIRLTELVTVLNPMVEARTFERCRFIGPAVIAMTGHGTLTGAKFYAPLDSIFIEYGETHSVVGPILFKDCVIRDCWFEGVGIIGPPDLLVRLQFVGVDRGGFVRHDSVQKCGDLTLAVAPRLAEPELPAALHRAQDGGLVGAPIEALNAARPASLTVFLRGLELATDE